jgi:hypothetical protein
MLVAPGSAAIFGGTGTLSGNATRVSLPVARNDPTLSVSSSGLIWTDERSGPLPY